MANFNNRLDFTVGYKVDKGSLSNVISELKKIQTLTEYSLDKKHKLNLETGDAQQSLKQIQNMALEVEKAFSNAYNPKLNNFSASAFNKGLQAVNLDMATVEKQFSRLGAEGTNAFRNLNSGLLTTEIKMKESNKLLNGMADTFKNTIRWTAATTALNGVTAKIQEAYYFTKNLDRSLNDIRIVTGNSADEMQRFA